MTPFLGNQNFRIKNIQKSTLNDFILHIIT